MGILLFSLAFILGITYISTVEMMGHEVAKRSIRDFLILFLLSIPIYFLPCFLIYYLLGDYGLYGLQFCGAIAFVALSLGWYVRKQKAGILLLDIGKNEDLWVTQVLLGLAGVIFVGFNAWSFFKQISMSNPQYASLVIKKVADLALLLSLYIVLISQGLSKTEFRSNGICMGTYFRFISWRRIKSYNWELSKPNILTIRYKPRFVSVLSFSP
ncbi:hypothetical protein [Altericista sp. CCNU0014]|uniref:hypothetical protein n=1 Tax=Altericista sp. CCNU0014 TaxID=3082949 RepID=UPI0038506FCB